MKERNVSLTTQVLVILSVVLLAANVFLGSVMMNLSKTAMRTQIQARMLDITDTAAAMIDGDVLETITAADEGTPAYQAIFDALYVFQNNIELEYIYTIRDAQDGTFIFLIDPAEENASTYGELVYVTEALRAANSGMSAVDETPYEDAYGRFYSAYSPVFDSAGRVAGIVAVDFSADWYDQQIAKNTRAILVSSAVSLLVGAVIVLLVTSRIRKRFRALHTELGDLAGDIDDLTREIEASSRADKVRAISDEEMGERLSSAVDYRSKDEINELGRKIRVMHGEMRLYIDHLHRQAFTDMLTGVGNRTAYLEAVQRLDERIGGGDADFAVAIFDINGLKSVNDTYGHEYGDELIIDAAAVLRGVFDVSSLYRIGGDEFVALLEGVTTEELTAAFGALDEAIRSVNENGRPSEMSLAFSKGGALYTPGTDGEYKDVFQRADQEMYRDKAAYYREHGDRRGR